MSKAAPLAIILLGLDASHHAVCRALTHAFTVSGTQPLVRREGFVYHLKFTISIPDYHQPDFYRVEVALNDGYFDAYEGGQLLETAYPIRLELMSSNINSASQNNGTDRQSTEVEFLNMLLLVIIKTLRWPTLVLAKDGSLIVAYNSGLGEKRFRHGAVTTKSPYKLWEHWIEPQPWPTILEYEDQ